MSFIKCHNPSLPHAKLLFFHSMPMISIATGGTKNTYDLCAYVAKDASGHRGTACALNLPLFICHVFSSVRLTSMTSAVYIFNCGELSDEVLDTFGQSFRLAQEIAMKKRERPDTQKVKQEYLNSAAEEAPAEAAGGVADLEAVMEQPGMCLLSELSCFSIYLFVFVTLFCQHTTSLPRLKRRSMRWAMLPWRRRCVCLEESSLCLELTCVLLFLCVTGVRRPLCCAC